jgi:hypothetical protein
MKLYLGVLKLILFLMDSLSLLLLMRSNLRYKIQRIEAYRPRPDDIFIVTFPKSGTTLMQMMLYQLTSDGSMEISHIGSVSPSFESELMFQRNSREIFEALPSPRFFKSHLPYEDLPRHGRFIYIARDVRDVAVSSFHQRSLLTGREQNFKPFINQFLRDRMPVRSWFKHMESWWPHRNDENVLFLTYDQIVKDIEGTVRKVAAFCGIAVDESDMTRIVERCGFGFMKQHWEKFDPRLTRVSREKTEFIRKGVAGAGRHELTPEQEELASRSLRSLASKLGCTPGEPHSELFA